ncbi:uncharacterized protein AB9X84_023734 isoform 2-T2 [Acanthopagrus schlegelii]
MNSFSSCLTLPAAVCHAQFASGFDTSAVNQLDAGTGKHHGKGKRDTSYGGLFSIAELDAVTSPPPARGRRHAGKPPTKPKSTPPEPPHVDDNIWTLYGLFQLSNHLVCSDGESPSPNICGMSCSQLTDDDIDDDINCLFTIFQNLLEKGFGYEHRKELMMMVRLIYQPECRAITASEYFTDCPSDTSS